MPFPILGYLPNPGIVPASPVSPALPVNSLPAEPGNLQFRKLRMLELEKEMATHSSVLAWRIPGTEEPVGLPSMGSCRVGHD